MNNPYIITLIFIFFFPFRVLFKIFHFSPMFYTTPKYLSAASQFSNIVKAIFFTAAFLYLHTYCTVLIMSMHIFDVFFFV